MESSTRRQLSGTFDRNASGYAAARPVYPDEVVTWLAGEDPTDVLDLGAGTGALSRPLAAAGHRVIAAEPSAAMLRELVGQAPHAVAVRSTAESLPFADHTFDVVTVATAFHWFDAHVALLEIARVLRRVGQLGLVWNSRVHDSGWPHQLGELLRGVQPAGLSGDWGTGSVREVEASPLFTALEYAEFPFTQRLEQDGLIALVGSRSYVISLDEPRRLHLLNQVRALFDKVSISGTVELPYRAQCWRTTPH